jgi:hypothetical protein
MLPFPSKSTQNEALHSSALNADLKLWSCGLVASGAKGISSWSALKPTHSFTAIQFVVTEGGITNGELNPVIPSYKLFYSVLIKWLPAGRFSHRSVTWISRFEQIQLSLQEMKLVRHYSQRPAPGTISVPIVKFVNIFWWWLHPVAVHEFAIITCSLRNVKAWADVHMFNN